jgi:hypothetical protein
LQFGPIVVDRMLTIFQQTDRPSPAFVDTAIEVGKRQKIADIERTRALYELNATKSGL